MTNLWIIIYAVGDFLVLIISYFVIVWFSHNSQQGDVMIEIHRKLIMVLDDLWRSIMVAYREFTIWISYAFFQTACLG